LLKVTVIIPHAGGRELLRDCLNSIAESRNADVETLIVHNGLVDDVDDNTLKLVDNVQVLRYKRNIGFAAACNRGVEAASTDYVFLLNNDAIVEPETIGVLAEKLASEDDLSACQPKILSLIRPGMFDYSSAAGGEIDRYGYPFACGRVFDTIEKDTGQYNQEREIFWGAGAALMIRREHYIRAGSLEERFFAHMEEIDLQWRFHLMGYRIASVPSVVACHRGAVTIKEGSFGKYYLNHRNGLAMLFRNYSVKNILKILPVRLALDLVLVIYSIFKADFVRARAVLSAIIWFMLSLHYLIGSRRQVQKLRVVQDGQIEKHIFPHSVVWLYFVKKIKTWSDLMAFRA